MKVHYEIELLSENASKIDQINKILLGDSYTEKSEKGSSFEKVEKDDFPSVESLTTCAKNCKNEHGEEFCMEVLEELDISTAKTLRGSLKNIPEEKRRAVMKKWVAGPQEKDEEEEEKDDWEEEEEKDTSKVDPEAVKEAVKAYAKEHSRDKAKKIMASCGFDSLTDIDEDADKDDLKKLFKKLI